MRIVVSDTSCLIDLRKASLLEAFINLPYDIMIPDTLFEDELLSFSKAEKTILLDGGIKVTELPGEGVSRAQKILSLFPTLSIHDCFAFTLAERNPNSILLTGDKSLRKIATNHEIDVHGVLWAIDAIKDSETTPISKLIAALELFEKDESVYLPKRDIQAFIQRFKTLL
jgi:predicted nucleic acid-binding protein